MAKRLLDLTLSLIGLILLLPLLLAIGVAIKLGSRGPLFYKAARVGKDGRLFAMYKFRTMADGPEGDGPKVTAKDDPRITRLGRFLRDTKLNELPQLLNVLRGDMSLVGPRPEDPEFVARYSAEEREVLSVRPGITSPASVLYSDEEAMLSFATASESYLSDILPSKLRLDLLYVRRRSFLLDLDVLVRTLPALIPSLRRSGTEAAQIFFGPIQRLTREQVPWFVIDWLTALAAVGLAGLIWRARGPLDLGWGVSFLFALDMALAFSLINRLLGVQRTEWRYASVQEVLDMALSTGLATALLVALNQVLVLPRPLPPRLPAGMLLLAGFFALAGFVVTRYRSRLLAGITYRWQFLRGPLSAGRERVLVIGGGEAGQLMVWLLQNGSGAQAFDIVGIVDDNLWKRGARIHRVRVLGDRSHIPELVKAYDVGLIVFAINKIEPTEREAILQICRATPARTVVVPDIITLLTQLVRAGRDGAGVHSATAPVESESGSQVLVAPVRVSDCGGFSIQVEAVARWMDDLARLADEGRVSEMQRQLRAMRAVLGQAPGFTAENAEGAEDKKGTLHWGSEV